MSEIIYKPFNCRLCGYEINPPPQAEISKAVGEISLVDITAIIYKCPNPRCKGTVKSVVYRKAEKAE